MMTKLADPRNDIAFKKIFSEDNIEGIKDFAESIISNAVEFPFSTKLVSIEFLHKDQMPSLLKGKNVITISIMGRKCFGDDIPCISYHPFKETTTGKQLLLTQSHIFIELPKLEKSGLTGSTLEWLEMFKEAVHMDHIPQVKNRNVLQAYHKLEQHNWSPEEKEAYLASKIEDDMEKNNLKHAEDKGREEEKIKIAQNLLASGLPVDLVIKTTGLSEAKIKELQPKIKS